MKSFSVLSTFLFFLSFGHTYAKVWNYDWNITWVLANPDGEALRPVIGINNQWPTPLLNITKGDRLIVNVTNGLGNETTGLHWHGIFQNGTSTMDGPRGVTSCPIPPGGSYTFNFTVDQPGSYWYHSHDIAQYPDGLRGPLIVQDPTGPYAGKYDAELVVTVSDWYHQQMVYYDSQYLLNSDDPDGAEPEPYSALMNDRQNTPFQVQPGLTYYVRLINIAAFSQVWFEIDQHNLTIIETDGNYVNETEVKNVFITVGQRYGLLMKTKTNRNRNYAMIGSMDEMDFDSVPAYVKPNVTGYLVYDAKKPMPPPLKVASGDFQFFDDFALTSKSQEAALRAPDQTIVMDLNFATEFGQNVATWNNITYLEQKVPSLFTALTSGENATHPEIYGVNANAQVLGFGNVIELVINNYDDGPHPIHIHGHAPQQIYRDDSKFYQPGERMPSNPTPMRRDTWMVNPGGHTVSRFVADNPGVWFVHCHMEWHLMGGLAFTLVEAPQQLQASQQIPKQASDLCAAQGIATAGNAAGKTENLFDLSEAVTAPVPSPSGALVIGHK